MSIFNKIKNNNLIKSIRTKLIISLVSICVIPLIIIGIISYNQSKIILTKNLNLTSIQTLSGIDDELNNYLSELSNMVSMTANNYDIINATDEKNLSYIPSVLQGLKESDSNILSAYFGTDTKKFIEYPYVKADEGFDATVRPWYKQAVEQKGEVIITAPYKDSTTGNSVITIAKAVENGNQVIGVVGIDYTLASFSNKMGAKKIGNNGHVIMLDKTGIVIANSQKNLIGKNISSKLSFWNDAKSKDNGSVNFIYDGIKKFGAYQTDKLTGWKIVASIDKSELTDSTNTILKTTSLIILIIGLISVGLSLLLSKGISDNIKNLKNAFKKASNGDLTVSIVASTNDEFKDLSEDFNLMVASVSEIIKDVNNSSKVVTDTSSSLSSMSEEVTASINDVARAITEVSQGATEQAQNAQDGASKMEKLSQKLDKISTNSNEMDKISGDTKKLSSQGLHMIDTLVEKSNKTKTATIEVSNIVQDMNNNTKQINAISETIADITAQTNLLSLNASIESARAGEAGRGFAVVANEIRKLAEQSKVSTEEIKGIIDDIQKKSITAVKAIKVTENVVQEQEITVKETEEIFNTILTSIELMVSKVTEIKNSITEINIAKQSTISEIESISAISEETASASEEVTASTEEITATMEEFTKHANELQALAENLSNEVKKFKVN